MTAFIGTLLVLGVAGIIALPLLRPATVAGPDGSAEQGELWEREKSIALVAIREAEFDQATGKLSDPDYALLRQDYEERALHAMEELDKLDAAGSTASVAPQAAPDSSAASFCTGCGRRFGDTDRFCADCGQARA